jgi:hypothetical protein
MHRTEKGQTARVRNSKERKEVKVRTAALRAEV